MHHTSLNYKILLMNCYQDQKKHFDKQIIDFADQRPKCQSQEQGYTNDNQPLQRLKENKN